MDYQEAYRQIDFENTITDVMQYMFLVFITMWVLYKFIKYLCQRDKNNMGNKNV